LNYVLIVNPMGRSCPPNGLAFSCRERAQKQPQKSDDLAREAVSCNAVLAGDRE
jgi:hypothetical protein